VSGARRGWLQGTLGGALSVLALCCGSSRGTERVFDGRVVQGSYIEPEAYAAYVEGVVREAHGEWAAAEQAYRRALRSDADSPQIWTRLGALACRQSLERALDDFERAVAAEEYAPAWVERARCLSFRQRPAEALQAALHAVQLDPRGAEANLLIVRLYHEASHAQLARSWLFAWLLLEPELEGRGAELEQRAEQLRDSQLSALVQSALQRRDAEHTGDLPLPEALVPSPTPALLQAIRAADLERARELAAGARISPLQLALLATQNAQPDLALAQAQLLLAANPRDSSALIAGLLAAALSDEEQAFRQLLRQTESAALPPAALAEMLERLLRSRVGDEAAQSWHAAYQRATAR
jgi:hypothetical protein